ncbi:YihY/virulence factor BrkB family protein [Streptomyces sp. VRA16 Mangrove soil]|uniref:YihY/virulence factor BrkB family protein n=1 Tax=Streptomyces sp. VRA16 Mangrove soil TaxID=2817434 RepID=UPI001A9DD6E6|nr:YihY/virulence factor BrkB family protein [Streptomyces sp. VRA16 Mangrove soil]MBO1330682.1 YihY/virulence factor BrkB family protein [Streptomyces sp. VRA16 Mangrove soil]
MSAEPTPVPAPSTAAAGLAPSPEDLRRALRRTPVSLWNDDITDYAAALTYYATLAVLPGLLVLVAAFGLVSPDTARSLIEDVTAYAPGQAGNQLHGLLTRMIRENAGAWTVIATGLVSALWSACSYLAVFRRALHRMHRTSDRRTPLSRAHRIILTAFALLALLVLTALVLVVSRPVAEGIGRALHLDDTVTLAWTVARWPLLLTLVVLLVSTVFRNGPQAARVRHLSLPGGVLAAVLWLIVTGGFALYTSMFTTYSRLYGSLAGTVVFLIWLWLSNLALLTGAQFSAELAASEGESNGSA